jgi:hypothetical protein
MPLGTIIRGTAARAADLQQRLTAEWQAPGSDSTGQPVLIEEEKAVRPGINSAPRHLYVIWEEWADLPQRERSEIIMDAYAASHETSDVLKVTVAMGLTAAEARKMGIQYSVS